MRDTIRKLSRKLKPADTQEKCGLVLTDGRVIETPNNHPNPENGFMIPAKLMIKQGEKLAGTWHTHPGKTSHLSQEDYRGFNQWPHLIHYIVGTDGVRAYRVEEGMIVEAD